MNYEQAIEFLQSRIRFGMRPGTERVAALVEALDHPQRSYPVLHIAGTNGKFSVLAIITSILSEMGLSVGTYTSPDLGNVRERIGFGTTEGIEPIDEGTFASTLGYLQPYIQIVEERLGDELTYFELLTAIAYEAFFDRGVHAAVIEAGLGGEYDATNVADAQVAVLTNVTLDHIRQFGGDLNKAAWEKAGIAKTGTTFITGVEQDDLFALIDKRATEKGASSVLRAGRDVEIISRRIGVGGQLLTIRGIYATYEEMFFVLQGEHQVNNALLAVTAVEAFVGQALDRDTIENALRAVVTPGRMEILRRRPLVISDGGHNPAAAQVVKETIQESFPHERLTLVVGMLSEKLIDEVLEILAPVADRVIVTAPKTDRAAEPARMVEVLERLSVEDVEVVEDVGNAIDQAVSTSGSSDLVLIFGSFYTATEAREHLGVQKKGNRDGTHLGIGEA
jgi:dihydrofolate synthase/folylpolyglutamate synthase